MSDLTLTGLDGANPLGFLAALGVLAAAGEADDGVRLCWRYDGAWRPVLASRHVDIASLILGLQQDREACVADPALALEYEKKRDLKPPRGRFRVLLLELSEHATPTHRRSVDWASAFATDVALDNKGNTKPTALHFTAGQQLFLQMVNELVNNVTADDFREALEGPWLYERPLPVMGWDATSSRDYALRATDPSLDKKRGVPGADWLAVRGMVFLPTFPRGTRIITTGCVGGWKDGSFRWPLWTRPLTAPVVRSLLGLDVAAMTADERRGRAIDTVLSAGIKRSEQGGYGSFEPSAVVRGAAI